MATATFDPTMAPAMDPDAVSKLLAFKAAQGGDATALPTNIGDAAAQMAAIGMGSAAGQQPLTVPGLSTPDGSAGALQQILSALRMPTQDPAMAALGGNLPAGGLSPEDAARLNNFKAAQAQGTAAADAVGPRGSSLNANPPPAPPTWGANAGAASPIAPGGSMMSNTGAPNQPPVYQNAVGQTLPGAPNVPKPGGISMIGGTDVSGPSGMITNMSDFRQRQQLLADAAKNAQATGGVDPRLAAIAHMNAQQISPQQQSVNENARSMADARMFRLNGGSPQDSADIQNQSLQNARLLDFMKNQQGGGGGGGMQAGGLPNPMMGLLGGRGPQLAQGMRDNIGLQQNQQKIDNDRMTAQGTLALGQQKMGQLTAQQHRENIAEAMKNALVTHQLNPNRPVNEVQQEELEKIEGPGAQFGTAAAPGNPAGPPSVTVPSTVNGVGANYAKPAQATAVDPGAPLNGPDKAAYNSFQPQIERHIAIAQNNAPNSTVKAKAALDAIMGSNAPDTVKAKLLTEHPEITPDELDNVQRNADFSEYRPTQIGPLSIPAPGKLLGPIFDSDEGFRQDAVTRQRAVAARKLLNNPPSRLKAPLMDHPNSYGY